MTRDGKIKVTEADRLIDKKPTPKTPYPDDDGGGATPRAVLQIIVKGLQRRLHELRRPEAGTPGGLFKEPTTKDDIRGDVRPIDPASDPILSDEVHRRYVDPPAAFPKPKGSPGGFKP